MTFDEDLEFGHKGERYIASLIESDRRTVEFAPDGQFKDWDLKTSDGLTIEVKTDRKSHLTGNFFIETGYKGNKSGILTTKACLYAILEAQTMKVWLFDVMDMKDMLRAKMGRYLKNVGDGSSGYLVSKMYFTRQYFKTLLFYEKKS